MGKKQQGRNVVREIYNMSFKLPVIDEIEKEALTYQQAQDLYGIQAKSPV